MKHTTLYSIALLLLAFYSCSSSKKVAAYQSRYVETIQFDSLYFDIIARPLAATVLDTLVSLDVECLAQKPVCAAHYTGFIGRKRIEKGSVRDTVIHVKEQASNHQRILSLQSTIITIASIVLIIIVFRFLFKKLAGVLRRAFSS